MDVAAANAHLRELGYSAEDAEVAAQPSRERLRIDGDLLRETSFDADDAAEVLAMLPSKAELLAYRAVVGLPSRSPGIRIGTRCSWCGSFSHDGHHWFRTSLPAPPGSHAGADADVCPACFDQLAPGTVSRAQTADRY